MKRPTVALAFVAFAGVAFATDYHWADAQDGAFGTAANWVPNTGAPGASDKAIFDAQGTYRVSEADASRTIGSVNVTNADVTVDLGGKTWTVTGPWSTYNKTTDAVATSTTISNGTLDVQHGTTSGASGIILSLKDDNVTRGNLRITGADTHVSTKALWMGGRYGSFVLEDGAACDVAGEVRWGGNGDGGSDNTVVIRGNGTSFRQTAAGTLTGNNIGDRNKVYFTDGASVYFTSI